MHKLHGTGLEVLYGRGKETAKKYSSEGTCVGDVTLRKSSPHDVIDNASATRLAIYIVQGMYALVYCLEAKWLQKTKDAGL